MAQTKKYRAYGVLRKNNLSDIRDKTQSLNNILNNLPGVDPGSDITFISEDLDAIRGLTDTNIGPSDFSQLSGSTPFTIRVDANGDPIYDAGGQLVSVPVSPLIRVEDRFKFYREITEDPPVFASGRGPTAYFVPSNLLPASFVKGANLTTQLQANLSNPAVQESDDFWVFGEFAITGGIRSDFADAYGGIMWDGYYIPDPTITIQTFLYETTGLFHVEFDRFGNGNWEVLKSIYAKLRSVLVQTAATASTTITLQTGETTYVSVGDYLSTNNAISITAIAGNVITLSSAITVTAGQTLIFDMPLGKFNVSGSYTISEILDRAETPQLRIRTFWWFPNTGNYFPDTKYLRLRLSGRPTFDFFYLNNKPANLVSTPGSARDLLANAITPSQDFFNSQFKSVKTTTTSYIPKPLLSQITKGSTNISFELGTRAVTGPFSTTELGNYIVPTAVADLGPVIPKNIRIKDFFDGTIATPARLVSSVWPVTRTNYAVNFINHIGLVDYFVVSSVGDLVTIQSSSGTNSKLKKDMFCVYNNTNQFVRITEVISTVAPTPGTQFRTSVALNLTNSYVYVYANAGIIDKSLDKYCLSVFGQSLAAPAAIGDTVVQLKSVVGIQTGMIMQFAGSIDPLASVVSVAGSTAVLPAIANSVTLSIGLIGTINQDETVVFAPAGSLTNKEICVLPLDLSPPFVGVPTGLDASGKNIRSSQATFNVKFEALTLNTSVAVVGISENYDSKIDLNNTTLSIIAKKVI